MRTSPLDRTVGASVLPSRAPQLDDTPLPFKLPPRIALVVDDEEMIRTIAGLVLEQAGYAVLKAGDADSAIETFRLYPHRVGLVFLDMTLAGRSGADVLAEIRRIDPGVRVLIASGIEPDPALLTGRTGYLAKPFDVGGLLRAVQGVG